MSFLEGLRSKPDKVKSRIAILSALVVTGIIGVVWTSTLRVRFEVVGESLGEKGIESTAAAKSALTNMVEEVTNAVEKTGLDDGNADDGTGYTFVGEESALDALAQERFEPTTTPQTPPPPATAPNETKVGASTSSTKSIPLVFPQEATTTGSGPRVILIGTTTKSTQ